jgi:hypothetical protein
MIFSKKKLFENKPYSVVSFSVNEISVKDYTVYEVKESAVGKINYELLTLRNGMWKDPNGEVWTCWDLT